MTASRIAVVGPSRSAAALDHAIRVVEYACYLGGSPNLKREIRNEICSPEITAAIESHDTTVLFDWLIATLSFQGIADRVAADYMETHGYISWRDIELRLAPQIGCLKLHTYWHFFECGYKKGGRTCFRPDLIEHCPLPTHDLRNGRLNRTAYALYLFIRDLANGDLVAWIDDQLDRASQTEEPDRVTRMQAAVVDPLRNIHGVSDKVITMALSSLLLAAPASRACWRETGAAMIVVDTLVHNFLHRTGILGRLRANHAYGAACYRPNGCADIISAVAERIDAREFGRGYPRSFPRFVQHAIWQYCAQQGRDVCNGNRIEDGNRCRNAACRIHGLCDRVPLKPKPST